MGRDKDAWPYISDVNMSLDLCGLWLKNQVMGLFLLKIFRFTCKINTLHNCAGPNQRASVLFDFGTKRPLTSQLTQNIRQLMPTSLCCLMNQLVLHISTRNGLRTHHGVILSQHNIGSDCHASLSYHHYLSESTISSAF